MMKYWGLSAMRQEIVYLYCVMTGSWYFSHIPVIWCVVLLYMCVAVFFWHHVSVFIVTYIGMVVKFSNSQNMSNLTSWMPKCESNLAVISWSWYQSHCLLGSVQELTWHRGTRLWAGSTLCNSQYRNRKYIFGSQFAC